MAGGWEVDESLSEVGYSHMIDASVALFNFCDGQRSEEYCGKEGIRNDTDLSFLETDSDTFYDALGPARSSKISSSIRDLTQLMAKSHVLHARFFQGGGLR